MSQPIPKTAPPKFGILQPLFSGCYYLWDEFTNGLMRLPVYTIATLPDAVISIGRMVRVSDAEGGETLYFSDGSDWLLLQSVSGLNNAIDDHLGSSTGTHNTNISGLVGTVNINITYRVSNGLVVLHIPGFSGTNDSADVLQTTTALPAALRPAATRYDTGKSMKGDSTVTHTNVYINTSGIIYWNGDPDPGSENWSSYTTNDVYDHTIAYSL